MLAGSDLASTVCSSVVSWTNTIYTEGKPSVLGDITWTGLGRESSQQQATGSI